MGIITLSTLLMTPLTNVSFRQVAIKPGVATEPFFQCSSPLVHPVAAARFETFLAAYAV